MLRYLASCLSVVSLVVVGCGSGSDGESQQSAEGPATRRVAASEVAVEKPASPPATEEQLKLWTPAAYEPVELLGVYEWEKTSFTGRVAALPDGKHFLAVGSRVILWSLDNDKEPEHVFLELTSDDGDRDLLSLDVSPDGKWFVVGDSNGVLRVWNLADRSEIVTKEIYSTGIPGLSISPDGKELATYTYGGEVTIWSTDKFEEIKKFEPDTTQLKEIMYVAPGVLAVVGESTLTCNTATGAVIEKFPDTRFAGGLARSADGSKFTYGADDKLVIADAKTGKAEGEIASLSGREQVEFSPDGKFLATNSGGAVMIWNLAERRLVQVIDSYGYAIVGVSWLPETNLLAVASENGVTRVWGTAEQGAKVGLKPIHAMIAKLDTPATPLQMQQVIDFRVLPRLPGSEMSIGVLNNLNLEVPVKPEEAMTFYRHFLAEAGWTEVDPLSPNAPTLVFEKDGFSLTASFYESDGKTSITLYHAGNLDLRDLPKFDAAEIKPSYESAYNMSYSTKADLLTIETNMLRVMSAAGWMPYTRINTSHSEQEDSRDVDFVKNGTSLKVSAGKFPVAPDSYTISYSLFPNNSSVPVPTDAGYVEFDGSTDPRLIAISKMSFDDLRKFYDTEMAKDGWIVRKHGKSEKGDSAWLNYLRDQNDVTIGMAKLENGKTLVRVGEASGSLWENSLPKDEEEQADEAVTAAVGVEAADFPILIATGPPKYDPLGEQIEIPVDGSTLADAAAKYTEAIEALGWKHDGRGIRDEDYTFLTFEKDDHEITFRGRKANGKPMVDISGDGLLWAKPLPGGKQLESYETWMRKNNLPPGLEHLDRFEEEMKGIGK
jgi:WD40 repeat protein